MSKPPLLFIHGMWSTPHVWDWFADRYRAAVIDGLEALIRAERAGALRLHAIQTHDSRIGYEASNHYFYVPMDLAEKVLNCDALLADWIPALEGGDA